CATTRRCGSPLAASVAAASPPAPVSPAGAAGIAVHAVLTRRTRSNARLTQPLRFNFDIPDYLLGKMVRYDETPWMARCNGIGSPALTAGCCCTAGPEWHGQHRQWGK